MFTIPMTISNIDYIFNCWNYSEDFPLNALLLKKTSQVRRDIAYERYLSQMTSRDFSGLYLVDRTQKHGYAFLYRLNKAPIPYQATQEESIWVIQRFECKPSVSKEDYSTFIDATVNFLKNTMKAKGILAIVENDSLKEELFVSRGFGVLPKGDPLKVLFLEIESIAKPQRIEPQPLPSSEQDKLLIIEAVPYDWMEIIHTTVPIERQSAVLTADRQIYTTYGQWSGLYTTAGLQIALDMAAYYLKHNITLY